jgi:hypothetical protein
MKKYGFMLYFESFAKVIIPIVAAQFIGQADVLTVCPINWTATRKSVCAKNGCFALK